jgi:hypothetical protein
LQFKPPYNRLDGLISELEFDLWQRFMVVCWLAHLVETNTFSTSYHRPVWHTQLDFKHQL